MRMSVKIMLRSHSIFFIIIFRGHRRTKGQLAQEVIRLDINVSMELIKLFLGYQMFQFPVKIEQFLIISMPEGQSALSLSRVHITNDTGLKAFQNLIRMSVWKFLRVRWPFLDLRLKFAIQMDGHTFWWWHIIMIGEGISYENVLFLSWECLRGNEHWVRRVFAIGKCAYIYPKLIVDHFQGYVPVCAYWYLWICEHSKTDSPWIWIRDPKWHWIWGMLTDWRVPKKSYTTEAIINI